MYPFSSTTGVKMIHDEMVQEALERQPVDTGEETQRPGLFQALGKVLARFNSQPARTGEASARLRLRKSSRVM